jgi:hypothetical protein
MIRLLDMIQEELASIDISKIEGIEEEVGEGGGTRPCRPQEGRGPTRSRRSREASRTQEGRSRSRVHRHHQRCVGRFS